MRKEQSDKCVTLAMEAADTHRSRKEHSGVNGMFHILK
jgi:hypothetical protein